MHEPSDPLARTKPLSDPVRTITLLMVAGAIIVGVVTAIFFVKAYGPFGAVLSLALTCCTVSFAMLLGPVGRPNAIYLRAFRTDRSTARLRAELGAILGPKFRLSGIRPPQRKTSLFLRFLVPGLVAMRYAGSKFMELEAGDDWMARLWKTYQTTRLVFIDLRDVTVHVHHEIQMTMATMGAERCIFVVDASKSADDWRETIAAIAGPQFDARTFKLLDASEERIRSWALAAELKVLLNSLPPGVPGETDRGRQFILEHVPENLPRAEPARFRHKCVERRFGIGALPRIRTLCRQGTSLSAAAVHCLWVGGDGLGGCAHAGSDCAAGACGPSWSSVARSVAARIGRFAVPYQHSCHDHRGSSADQIEEDG